MKRLKNITILLCFLSLLAFISCSAEDKMGGKVTPPSGEPATDLPNGYYKGNLTCKTCIIGDDFHADESSYGANYKQELEQEMKNDNLIYLKIANNKLKRSRYEDALESSGLEESGALKSGSEYSVTYSFEDNATYIAKIKETIRFTISGDTISITYILEESSERKNDSGSDVELKYSVIATYEGTLTKYTPTTTP